MTLNRRITRRAGLGLAASAVAAMTVGRAVAQDATPSASPVASVFPSGPLGEHAQWFVDSLNAGPGSITTDQINSHFSMTYFETTSMPAIFKEIGELQSSGITWEVDPNSVIATMDEPTSNLSFVLNGSDSSQMEVAMTLDRESELIGSLAYGPVGSLGGTPEASPVS